VDVAATHAEVSEAMFGTLAAASVDDVVVIAFAGHGSPDGNLVLFGTNAGDIAGTALSMAGLVDDRVVHDKAIATTIIGLVRAKPEHPVTIGVHADWGAGKSSVLEMIEAGFANTDDVLCLRVSESTGI
jgi:hypothetical protein